MERICASCGSSLMEGALFCAECGAKVEDLNNITPAENMSADAGETNSFSAETDAEPLWDEAPLKPAAAAPFAMKEAPQAAQPEAEPLFKAVKTSSYFWLILLFSIPLIGLIAMLVISFTSKNNSLRNFARAALIWILIILLLMGVTVLALLILNGTSVIDLSRIDLTNFWQKFLYSLGF